MSLEVVYLPRASDRATQESSLAIAARWLVAHPERLVVIPRKNSRFGKPALDAFCELFPSVPANNLSEPLCADRRVVLVWPSKRLLAKLDRYAPEAVCVLRWADEDTDDWLLAHAATELTTGV